MLLPKKERNLTKKEHKNFVIEGCSGFSEIITCSVFVGSFVCVGAAVLPVCLVFWFTWCREGGAHQGAAGLTRHLRHCCSFKTGEL